MKKLLALACAFTIAAGFISCGPSAEERKADSANNVQTKKEMDNTADHMIDSMNKANEEMMRKDSTDAANKKADSTRKADSAKASKKK